ARRFGLGVGVAALALFIVFSRFVTYRFPQILDLRQFELFDPQVYRSSFLFSSLGDLLVNGVLCCWLMLFTSRRFDVTRIHRVRPAWLNFLMMLLAVVVLVVVTFIFADILQSLVADAQISFNVTNFFSLTKYSFI